MARKKLQPKKIALLEAARATMAEKGHGNFSMRSVAKTAGVHLRTVQHYFPTKRDLLIETCEYTIATYYIGQYPVTVNNYAGMEPLAKFDAMIGFLFDDLKDPFVCMFFPELWALSFRDPDASTALDRLYKMHRASIATVIAEACPGLSPKTVAHRAALVAMMIEGLILVVGNGKPQHAELRGIRAELIFQARNIIEAPEK